jgi:hypothetical protein
MRLLDGENVLLESKSQALVLTTHRVRFEQKSSVFTSIMLEQVCSVEGRREGIRSLAIIGLISLALALLVGYAESRIDPTGNFAGWPLSLALVGIALILLYFLARPKMIVIKSAGASIACSLGLLGQANLAEDFADAIESAKDGRFQGSPKLPPSLPEQSKGSGL